MKALQFLSIKDNYKKMKVCNELQWQKEEEGANDDCLKPHLILSVWIPFDKVAKLLFQDVHINLHERYWTGKGASR